ncbi:MULTISPECIES: hypothetical protein [unclassified Pantoea]|uniref:hypothetical protein n=1 Tax=unclassified Pantoea TaxID=2630326 RepID=UPI001CD7D14A|nr:MULTISPECIES: hypothetical protein [unclassified Pantoea]MCA1174830.1 hypothetical protein [Pantoea sp. alder69]MCA1253922.1 hypothetical protein [Pantoea sp. alder70]MCA1264253.1 hypothetical protein [Pantoea sp. alder81]
MVEPKKPRKIDLSKINFDDYENIDVLIKKLIEEQKKQLGGDQTAHASDHRSSHTNQI